jgi:serine/threonine-protein kinase
MRDAPAKPGDVLMGKYRVDRVIGAGTMGTVVAATQLSLERPVAIKFMAIESGREEEAEERFLREGLAVGKLRSEHVIRVYDVGKLPTGEPYIVMEYLDGKDLAALLAERGRFDVESAVSLILQACEGVAEAHSVGVVHRDIKPANLFVIRGLDGSPCVKMLDFGVAKLGTRGLSLTVTQQMLGSPLYMSPEALNGSKDVDARTDIWALAVCLYQMLAGRLPFPSGTIQELMSAVFFVPPELLAKYRPDVPAGLAQVIEHALEKKREQRFPSVAAFAAALAPYAPPHLASLVERIARMQRADVEPAVPTVFLPHGFVAAPPSSATIGTLEAAPTRREPANTSVGAITSPPRPSASSRATVALSVLSAALAAALAFTLLRERSPATERAPPTAAPALSGTTFVSAAPLVDASAPVIPPAPSMTTPSTTQTMPAQPPAPAPTVGVAPKTPTPAHPRHPEPAPKPTVKEDPLGKW